MSRSERTWRIDTVLGSHRAADLVHALAAAYMREDRLPDAAAYSLAFDLAATGTAWQLVRVGQLWRLRDEFADTADFTPRWIRITAVARACAQGPMRVAFADQDPHDGHPWRTAGHLRVDDLALQYELYEWPNPPARPDTHHRPVRADHTEEKTPMPMTIELAVARAVDAHAVELADAVFGRMIVCADDAAALRVAERLADDGHPVLWSYRITPTRVFLDRPDGGGIHRAPTT